jgi:hypothetical protein
MEHYKKITPSLTIKHGGGLIMLCGCFAASGTGGKASWNQQIIKVFWSPIFNTVSKNWVSVKGCGSSSRTMTPSTHHKAPKNGSKNKRCSRVASIESRSESLFWKEQLVEGTPQILQNWSSLQLKSGPKFQQIGTASSLMATSNVCQ